MDRKHTTRLTSSGVRELLFCSSGLSFLNNNTMRRKIRYPFYSVELLQKKLKEQEDKRELLVNKVSGYDLRILEIKELIKERSKS